VVLTTPLPRRRRMADLRLLRRRCRLAQKGVILGGRLSGPKARILLMSHWGHPQPQENPANLRKKQLSQQAGSHERTLIKPFLASSAAMDQIRVNGWSAPPGFQGLFVSRAERRSCLKNLQVIVDEAVPAFAQLKDVATGAAVEIEGAAGGISRRRQKWEVKASGVRLLAAPTRRPTPFRKSGTPTSS